MLHFPFPAKLGVPFVSVERNERPYQRVRDIGDHLHHVLRASGHMEFVRVLHVDTYKNADLIIGQIVHLHEMSMQVIRLNVVSYKNELDSPMSPFRAMTGLSSRNF